MAFYEIPVVSGKVSGTHSNFPVYIKPSAITGLPTLTLAEAQSSRWYTDEAKTTEIAREIVSADEIHVKVPSVTTTTKIYVDYDGVRADYAVGATYGRNAVWSDYGVVYHMQSIVSSQITNSTGGTNGSTTNLVSSSTLPTETSSGRMSGGHDFGTTAQNRAVNTQNRPYLSSFDTPRFTESMWFNTTVTGVFMHPMERNQTSGFGEGVRFNSGNTFGFRLRNGTAVNSTASYANTGWVYGALIKNADTAGNGYVRNASNNQWVSVSGTLTDRATEYTILGLTDRATPVQVYGGLLDEYRFRNSAVTEAWLDTEYNNQSDVGAFWGTAVEIGGGGASTSNFFPFF